MRLSVAILVFILSITGISYAYWNQKLEMNVNIPVVYTMDSIVVKEEEETTSEEETESQASEVIEQESLNTESLNKESISEISTSEVETTKE